MKQNAAYVGKKLLESQVVIQLSHLRLDGKRETLEELVTIAIKRHFARLHQQLAPAARLCQSIGQFVAACLFQKINNDNGRAAVGMGIPMGMGTGTVIIPHGFMGILWGILNGCAI